MLFNIIANPEDMNKVDTSETAFNVICIKIPCFISRNKVTTMKVTNIIKYTSKSGKNDSDFDVA